MRTDQQLFKILQNRPPREGEEILRHIQNGADAETVLKWVRDGDMLLQLSLEWIVRRHVGLQAKDIFHNGAKLHEAWTELGPQLYTIP